MAVLIFLKCLDLRKNVYSRTSSYELVRECTFNTSSVFLLTQIIMASLLTVRIPF